MKNITQLSAAVVVGMIAQFLLTENGVYNFIRSVGYSHQLVSLAELSVNWKKYRYQRVTVFGYIQYDTANIDPPILYYTRDHLEHMIRADSIILDHQSMKQWPAEQFNNKMVLVRGVMGPNGYLIDIYEVAERPKLPRYIN